MPKSYGSGRYAPLFWMVQQFSHPGVT
jgi:hypothetical protein